jgi:hypothetical protein
MATALIRNQLMEYLNKISFEQQQMVLDFARSLKSQKPHGVSGNKLADFAGIFSPDEVNGMAEAVQSDCSRVDQNGW